MAHVDKFKKDNAIGILEHDDRTEVNKHANENIDNTLSYLNFDYITNEKTPYERYKELFKNENIKILNRKNVNVICAICITMPKKQWNKIKEDYPDNLQKQTEECREYFQVAFNYLNKKFEKEDINNVISAIVHMDEKTPHLHFKFMPLSVNKKVVRKKSYEKKSDRKDYESKNKAQYKCDYTHVCPRGFYSTLHPSLVNEYKQVEKYAEFAQELNNKQTLGVDNIQQYKEVMKIITELEERIKKMTAENERLSEGISTKSSTIRCADDIINDLEKTLAEKEKELEKIKKNLQKEEIEIIKKTFQKKELDEEILQKENTVKKADAYDSMIKLYGAVSAQNDKLKEEQKERDLAWQDMIKKMQEEAEYEKEKAIKDIITEKQEIINQKNEELLKKQGEINTLKKQRDSWKNKFIELKKLVKDFIANRVGLGSLKKFIERNEAGGNIGGER